ncbi:MAG: hypothetical protein ABI947_09115, partial [Chloroflexota bacterium]
MVEAVRASGLRPGSYRPQFVGHEPKGTHLLGVLVNSEAQDVEIKEHWLMLKQGAKGYTEGIVKA